MNRASFRGGEGAILLVLVAILYAALLQVAAELAWPMLPVALVALAPCGLLLWAGLRRGGVGVTETGLDRELTRSWGLAGVALLVVLGLAVRLHGLLDRPAWEDEMWTLRNIYTSDWGELLRVAFDDYWPPLHYLVLNTVARVADTGLFWLRIPSVVFGAASVAALYPIGLLLFRSQSTALLGSALLAGMTSHVLYSQEARVYALLVCLAILSAYFFYRSYWDRRISAAYVVSTTLLTYSHSFSSWYFIASQTVYLFAAWVLWRDRRAFIQGLTSQALVFLLWLPLVAAFAYSRFARGIVVPTYWATGTERPHDLYGAVELYQGLAVRSWAGAAFMLLLFGLALLPVLRPAARPESARPEPAPTPGYPQAVLFLLCWIVVPVLFSFLVTVGSSMKTFGEIRYHLAVLPGMCLLAAGGLLALRGSSARAAVAAIALVLPASQLHRHFRTHQQPAVDQAVVLVRTHGRPEEQVYAGHGFRVFAYYDRGIFPRIGSAQWDSLAAAHAHLKDRRTLTGPKWGDTYAYEKFSPRIASYSYYPGTPNEPEQRYEQFIRDELERGGFRGTFWLVLDQKGQALFAPTLERMGVACRSPERYAVRGLELRRCNPPG